MKAKTVKKLKQEIVNKSINEKQAELLAEIENENRKKIQECADKIGQVCKDFGCTLSASATFSQDAQLPIFSIKVILAKK